VAQAISAQELLWSPRPTRLARSAAECPKRGGPSPPAAASTAMSTPPRAMPAPRAWALLLLPLLAEAQCSGSGCDSLNACSNHMGYGPASRSKVLGMCPLPPTPMHRAFVASWESSLEDQRSLNPVWGHLHMSVGSVAPDCDLGNECSCLRVQPVFKQAYGHGKREKCSMYYDVKDVKYVDGGGDENCGRTCYQTFMKTCFEKQSGWHTVVECHHDPNGRHWKYFPR